MPEPVLSLRGVVKDYGDKVVTRVLHGVDLDVGPGELTAIIGPSGSGKSTLLNLVGLLERPTAGTIRVIGRETTTLSEADRARIRGETLGFVFQFHHLLKAFSALENVYMPLLALRGRKDAQMVGRARELLGLVGLSDKERSRPSQMSGGQQQRVAIARALAADPRVVLADEPTGNLDTASADAIFDLFRTINAERGTSILVVTHDPRLADRCDRVVRVLDGRIASDEAGRPAGPCRACGFDPCLRDSPVLSEDIPRRPVLPLAPG